MSKLTRYLALVLGLIAWSLPSHAFEISATYADDCDTSCTASFTITATGGIAPYQYSIDNGATFQSSPTFSNLCAAHYDVVVQDANSDTESMVWTVWNYALYAASTLTIDSVTISYPSSYGTCDGTLTIHSMGGAAPYQYEVNGTVQYGDSVFTGLCGGIAINYTVRDTGIHQSCFPTGSPQGGAGLGSSWCDTVVNAAGDSIIHCWHVSGSGMVSQSASGGFTMPWPPQIAAVATDVTCFGFNDGTVISWVANGGTPPFTFSPSDYLAMLGPGVYTVSVTDALGLSDQITVTVAEPTELLLFSGAVDVTCYGDCDGEIFMAEFGGVPPYIYLLDGALLPGPGMNGLCAGTYTAEVIDANGCPAIEPVVVNEPPQLTASIISWWDPVCAFWCDGSATVDAAGGTPPYTYLWTNGETTATASSLCAGNYDVTVTDANGCIATTSIALFDPPIFMVSAIETPVSCYSDCDGQIDIMAVGGFPPYWYMVTGQPAGPNPNFSNLCPGTYTVEVFDANGCYEQTTVTITEPTAVDGAFTAFSPSCAGGCDGNAIVIPSGGTTTGGNYQYVWDGVVSASASNTSLCAGTHTLTILDDNGCSWDTIFVVIDPPGIVFTASAADASATGVCDGSITATASGGNGTLSYSIDLGVTTQSSGTFNNLCAGTYQVIVYDAGGCSDTMTLLVDEPDFFVKAFVIDTLCVTLCQGIIDITGFNGVTPYQYSIDAGATFQPGSSFHNLCAGTYHVWVEDATGAVGDTILTLTDPPPFTLDLQSNPASAVGACDGDIVVTPQGGIGPYDISIDTAQTWMTTPTSLQYNNMCAGGYLIMATDAHGCPNIDDPAVVYVNEPSSVWPGDANHDGTANNVDYLYVGLANTQTGAPRVAPQINWQAYQAADWSGNFLDGTNHKHADCDGLGSVGASDTIAILQNYDSLWTTPPPFPNNANNNDPALYLVASTGLAQVGTVVHVDVILGDVTVPVNAIHGLAFSIDYDTAIIEQGDITMTFPTSFMGTPNVDTWVMSHDDYDNGVIDGAITRFDQTDAAGYGIVAELEVVMPDDVSGKKVAMQYDTLVLATNDILGLDAAELELTIGWRDDTIVVFQEVSGIADVIAQLNVTAYPNPTNGVVTVEANRAVDRYRVLSITGQVLQTEQTNQGRRVAIDLNNLAPGMYLLEVSGDNAVGTCRILKQ